MKTANHFLAVARSFLGKNEADGSFKEILKIYNEHRPLAVGYTVKESDDWCDAFVSAVAIHAGMAELTGTECGCERHIRIWREMGTWIPGSIVPKPGDIFALDWNGNHEGYADHVGIVEYVQDGVIHTIEGNRGGAVRRKQYNVGDPIFKGFNRPRWESEAPHKSLDEIAREVYRGEWGAGDNRKDRLTAAGYDFQAVQKRVQELYYQDKTPAQIAHEIVVEGKWGNGKDRENALAAAGYDYDAVQAEVEKLMEEG